MNSLEKGILSPTSNMVDNFKIEKDSYFEIHRTPPEEKRRIQKAMALAASQEAALLLLTPFTTIPRISFDQIKLGTSSVRKLIVRNPGTKELIVSIERPPAAEKGFAIDYLNFRLGGHEETTLHVGWTPLKGGGVRDNIVVKFGGFRTQVILIGSCVAPVEKKQYRPPPSRPVRPLGVRNAQKATVNKSTKPKSGASAATSSAPKITIPTNPVVVQNESPPKRIFTEDGEVLDQPSNRRETFVSERPLPTVNDVIQSTPKIEGSNMGPPNMIPSDRRQTYLPRELEQGVEEDKENRPSTRRQKFKTGPLQAAAGLGPNSRKATYIKSPDGASWTPQKPAVFDGSERRKWSPTRESFGNLTGLRNLNESAVSSVFGDVTTGNVTDVSLALNQYCLSPEKETSKICDHKANIQRPEIFINSPTADQQQQQPLNLSVKKAQRQEVYQPDVSDISLAEYDLNLTGFSSVAFEGDNVDGSLAVNVSGWKYDKRLDDFDGEDVDLEDDGEYGQNEEDIDRALDEEIERLASQRAASACKNELLANQEDSTSVGRVSTGTIVRDDPTFEASNLPDCTDISINLPTIDISLNLPELDNAEAQNVDASKPKNIDSNHINRLPTPTFINESHQGQLQTPEIIVTEDISTEVFGHDRMTTIVVDQHAVEAFRFQEDMVCIEKEVVTEEVIEEVVEYEYEIRNGVKVCVGTRNLGKTVTTQETEKICGTPVKQTNVYEKVNIEHDHAEKYDYERKLDNQEDYDNELEEVDDDDVDVSKLIEDNLQKMKKKDIPRGAKLSDSELDGMLGMLALSQHKQQSADNNKLVNEPENNDVDDLDVPDNLASLPGLRGSPKFSNQQTSGGLGGTFPQNSFLYKTVTEANFMPPSPDDPRRCSTGIKDKNKDCVSAAEPSPHIKKSLFQPQDNKPTDNEFQEVPLSSGGHALPIIQEPLAGDLCRLSSDTYVAADEAPPLSIIQELEEMSQTKSLRTNNTTTEKDISPSTSLQQETSNKSKELERKKTFQTRTPAKPSRANAKYSMKPIEDAAIDSYVEQEDSEVARLTSGMMFVAISPEKQEKRKSSEQFVAPEASKKEVKKSRYSIATSRATNKRVASLPRRSVGVTSSATRPGISSSAVKSVASKPVNPRRSIQPSTVSRLNLSKKRNSTAVAGMNPGLGAGSTRPNPFASRNRYYDERWIEKQEKGFCNWLNFILTPQSLDTGSEESQGTFDIAKLWVQCSQGVKVPRAPTREVMSIRAYTVNREMNRLRRAACKLWQSRAVATIIERMELEIEKLRLVIRKDKQINKDVGMKQKILSLLLSYNPLWLRIALETVYGEVLMLHGNSDILGISRFLITRFLSCPGILQEYAHPTVPHSYREGHQEALNKFTLKKFLEIVYLLDQAKENRLIRHNPCLFCPDSKIKSSRDMLITFSKDYLSGEGDIIKHLSYLDYSVSQKQTILDEFDYAVTSISSDLRCGLRLTKVAELVTGGLTDLSRQLRVPTVSRLQKIHNTEVALKHLKSANPNIPDNISAKDVCDGHREKTLSLLWNIIFGFQLNEILDEDKLRSEILHLRKSLRLRVRIGDKVAVKGAKFIEDLKSRSPTTSSGGLLDSYNVGLLKEWAQLVTAHYHVEIENWTVSWCDGRGLCYLMHHYQPALMSAKDIMQETTTTSMSCSAALDDSLEFSYGNQNLDKAEYNNLLDNEKKNFKVLLAKARELGGVPILINTGDMSNTIPDEKVTVTFIGYLAARLLDISREIQAARTIQLAWRKYYAAILEQRMKVKYKQ